MKIFSTIIFILLISICNAQDVVLNNKELVLSSINKVAQNTSSITAEFTQTKVLSYLKEPIKNSGKFYSSENNMRWEQTKPYLYVMLVSEEGLKIKDEDKEKKYGEMAEKYVSQIRKILQTSFQANFESNTDFTPKYYENKTYYKVILSPQTRQLKKIYKSIEISFDKTSFRLKMITFVEEDGFSEIKFYNETFNNLLNANLFTDF